MIQKNIIILLFSVLLISCSGNQEVGKWVKSINDVKVFVEEDFDEKYEKSSLKCIPSGYSPETKLPYPPFKISVKTKGDNPQIVETENYLPSLIPSDSLIYRFEDGSFYVIAGNVKKKKIEGYAWRIAFTADSVIRWVEYGDFKNNSLIYGESTLIIPEKNKTIFESGRFKDSDIYLGIRQVQYGDSIGDRVIGVWEKDGTLNPAYLSLVRQLIKVSKEKGLSPEKIDEEDIAFTHRYFFWLKHKWWFFILLSIAGLFFVIYPLVMVRPKDAKGRKKWDEKNYRIKPWSKRGAYWRWLFFGWMGLDRVYLRKYSYASFGNLILWVAIVGSSKFIALYLVRPEYWHLLLPSILNYWQGGLILAWLFYFLLDLFIIPYRVYKLNFRVYRKNIYEQLILSDGYLAYAKLCKDIPEIMNRDLPKIKDLGKKAKSEYEEEQGRGSKFFSFLTNSKVKFAREKAGTLNGILKDMSYIARQHANLLSDLLRFLEIERKNAYRNMILAKELIFLITKGGSKQKDLMKDRIERMNIQSPQILVVPPDFLPDVDFSESMSKGFRTFDSTFSMLKDSGFNDKESMMVSLGIGAIESAFDGIIQINNRRTAEREYYEYMASDMIQDINSLERNLLQNHSKMLRAKEIMEALSAANEAFVKAYAPLRDYVFGTKASFKGFLNSIGSKYKKKANEITVDIGYLIAVCGEYNKINQSKI